MENKEPFKGIYTVTFGITGPENYSEDLMLNKPCETWRLNGEIDRHDGPAVTIRNDDGEILRTEYWRNGELHREGGLPAIDTITGTKHWYEKGKLHRERGPALEFRESPTDPPYAEGWSVRGVEHRVGGPSYKITDRRNGIIEMEEWKEHGVFHREDGPAFLERDINTGVVTVEEWMRRGISYRENGPFDVYRDGETGQVYRSAGVKKPSLGPST